MAKLHISYLFLNHSFSESLSSKDQESKDPQTCEEMGAAAIQQWKSLIVVTGSPYR